MKSSTLTALHSSASPGHGTPPEIVEAARRVLGGIDLDPASSAVFNKVVRADRFYDVFDDGLSRRWSGRVFCNPPGDHTGSMVKAFWAKLVAHYRDGDVTAAVWIGFSIDQLQTLQQLPCDSPMSFPFCVPKKRLCFIKALGPLVQQDLFKSDPDPTPVRGGSPTKPNFICLLPAGGKFGDDPMLARFKIEFEKFGEVRL